MDLKGNIIKVFKNSAEAGRELGIEKISLTMYVKENNLKHIILFLNTMMMFSRLMKI